MRYLASVIAVSFLMVGCKSTPDINDQVRDLSSIPKLPANVISGKIFGGLEGLRGIDVELYANCFDGPVIAKTYTGSKGEYRLKHIKPGKYAVGINNFRGAKGTIPAFHGNCNEVVILPEKEGLHYDVHLQPRKTN